MCCSHFSHRFTQSMPACRHADCQSAVAVCGRKMLVIVPATWVREPHGAILVETSDQAFTSKELFRKTIDWSIR